MKAAAGTAEEKASGIGSQVVEKGSEIRYRAESTEQAREGNGVGGAHRQDMRRNQAVLYS